MMLISEKLVELIEHNADSLTKQWLAAVQKHPDTPTYHKFNPDELYRRSYTVYSQLGKWLSKETTKEDIAKYYITLGQQRRKEGFALSEVIQALIITRRHLWLKVISEGLLDTALELYRAMELNNRVVLFFDRAIFYTSLGYERGN
jgi:hypothetical protein